MGKLYIVSTPIGSLEDITLRALRVLSEADVILCEDTRRTGMFLNNLYKRFEILFSKNKNENQRLVSYYDQIELKRIPEVVSALKSDLNIALISDAGTPLISDPGFKLVRECRRENLEIVVVPGASSVLASIVVSGLPTDKFVFLGYPPRKPGHRIDFFNKILKSQEYLRTTFIMLEAPHKILKTLEEFFEIFGDIQITICRELTKVHEEVLCMSVSEFINKYKKSEPKGEIVMLWNTNI